MPGVATTVSAQPGPGDAWRRAWSAPLIAHAVVLAAVLSLSVILVGDDGVFSSDEGAGLAQAEAVSDGRWGIEHPLPAVDPSGRWFPLEASAALPDGEFAPLPKKAAYSWVNAQLWGVGGERLVMGLSAFATALAALLAALVTRELDPRLDRAALWTAGLASPLLADGLLVIAHTVAAAAAAAAGLAVVRWLRTRAPGWGAAVVAASAIAVLVRAEAMLLAAGMVGAALVLAVLRREAKLLAAGAMVTAGAAGGFVLDRALAHRLFGGSSVNVPAASSEAGSFLSDRLSAFATTWLRPGYGAVTMSRLVGIIILLVGLAVVVLVRRGERGGDLRVLCVGVAVLAVIRVVLRAPDPDVVPGLLVAFPMLVWGLAGLRRAVLTDIRAAWLALSAALFSGAVLATQYRQGGAWEWGGRYFAVGLPLVVPLVVVGGRDALQRLDVSVRTVAIAAVVAVGLSSATLQVLAVRYSRVLGHDLVEHALDVAARTPPGDGGLPVVIATEPELPRGAWAELDEARWLFVPIEEVGDALDALSVVGIDQVVLATLAGPEAVREVPQLADGLDGPAPPEGIWWFPAVTVR